MSIGKLIIAAMLVACGASGHAQTYPTRAVRVIVPFPPGGSTDILARAMGQKLSEAWHQQVIIDNRPERVASSGRNWVPVRHATATP